MTFPRQFQFFPHSFRDPCKKSSLAVTSLQSLRVEDLKDEAVGVCEEDDPLHSTCEGHKGQYGYSHKALVRLIIIYLCTDTQHYCLLTGGAVKIKSGPLWF